MSLALALSLHLHLYLYLYLYLPPGHTANQPTRHQPGQAVHRRRRQHRSQAVRRPAPVPEWNHDPGESDRWGVSCQWLRFEAEQSSVPSSHWSCWSCWSCSSCWSCWPPPLLLLLLLLLPTPAHSCPLLLPRPSRINQIASLEGHQGNVTAVAWQNDGKWIVTACEDGRIKIWDPRAPKHPQRIFDHGGVAVNDCVIHPNQGELVSCDQAGAIKIWDLGGKACTHELVSRCNRGHTVSDAGMCRRREEGLVRRID